MTLSGVEFLRRWVQHVLPRGFVKIRSYGLLANRHREEKIGLCRRLLMVVAAVLAVFGVPIEAERPRRVCPVCGATAWVIVERFVADGLPRCCQSGVTWDSS